MKKLLYQWESYASLMISISSIFQAFAYITIGGLAHNESDQYYSFRTCAIIAAGFTFVRKEKIQSLVMDVALEATDFSNIGGSVYGDNVISEDNYKELWAKYVFECDMYFGIFENSSYILIIITGCDTTHNNKFIGINANMVVILMIVQVI